MAHPVVRAVVFDAGHTLLEMDYVWGERDCAIATGLLAAVEYAVKPHAVWRS
jgi:hypothetical protein